MSTLRAKVVRLAKAHPELQEHLVPLLKRTAKGIGTRYAVLRNQGDTILTLGELLSHRESADTVKKAILQITRDAPGVEQELLSAEVGERNTKRYPVMVEDGLGVTVAIVFPAGVTEMDVDIIKDIVKAEWGCRLAVKGRF